MTSIFSIGTSKLISNHFFSNRLYKLSKTCSVGQKVFITSKAHRADRPPRLPPFPYKTRKYDSVAMHMDRTVNRFDDNTKIISVEGTIAIGKTEFAKKLAEELDMYYMKPPTFDTIYIDKYNFDIRSLDDELPSSAKTCDVKKYLTNPHFLNVPAFQFQYYLLKLQCYVKSLVHLLSTGEGIVFERSPFTDYVFMKAMYNAGYVRKEVLKAYKDLVYNTAKELLPPHLFIYLDAPVPEVKKKIKQRNIDFEVNSKVLTDTYIADIENIYKHEVLKNLSEKAHVLMYDWSKPSDIIPVIEDIEDLNFEDYESGKFDDWVFVNEDDLNIYRDFLCNDSPNIYDRCSEIPFSCSELYTKPEELDAIDKVMEKVPSYQYYPGYHKHIDKGWFWKSAGEEYDPFEPREVPPEMASKLG